MSYCMWSGRCAVLFLLSLVMALCWLPATDAATQVDKPLEQSAEARIEAILGQPLKKPLNFHETPLQEIMDYLGDEYNLPIVFDLVALDELAISPELEVTSNLRQISLGSALKLILRQPGAEDLIAMVDNEVLLITTIDRAHEARVVRMFRVDDLVLCGDASDARAANTEGYSSLVEAIPSCVAPHSWRATSEMGSPGIALLPPGILVVTQTREVHEQIENFLRDLRAVREQCQRADD